MACPNCGFHREPVPCPPEPPVGTWVRDRFGAVHQRQAEGWGDPGSQPFGHWAPMWEARGPLAECGPWGAELPDMVSTGS
jgi:hypothetical protein